MTQSAALARRDALPIPKFIDPDDMPDVYATTCVGTCMEPLLPDGACCVFDKRRPPASGDVVVLIFTRQAAMRRQISGWVKRLIMPPPPAGFDGFMLVEQINPRREFWIATGDVLAIHKFIGTAISQGDGMAMVSRKLLEAA